MSQLMSITSEALEEASKDSSHRWSMSRMLVDEGQKTLAELLSSRNH